jgi:hypothetical protein
MRLALAPFELISGRPAISHAQRSRRMQKVPTASAIPAERRCLVRSPGAVCVQWRCSGRFTLAYALQESRLAESAPVQSMAGVKILLRDPGVAGYKLLARSCTLCTGTRVPIAPQSQSSQSHHSTYYHYLVPGTPGTAATSAGKSICPRSEFACCCCVVVVVDVDVCCLFINDVMGCLHKRILC